MPSGVRTLTCVGVVGALCCMFLVGAASAAPKWLGALDLSSVSDFAQSPSVAVDPEGEAVALWSDLPSGGGELLEASVHPPDGAWRPPQTVASGTNFNDQVAFDAQGDATAVWLDGSGTVQSSTLAAGAASWSASAPVSPAGGASSPDLVVDAQGNAIVVWAGPSAIQSSFRPAGTSTWQPSAPLSTAAGAGPRVALDSQGDAVAVWTQASVVWAASRSGLSGIWQTPVEVSNPSLASSAPVVAIDPAGRATAIWADANGIHTADQPLDGAWSSPATISGSAGSSAPDLAVDPQGAATAVWNQPAGSGEAAAETASRPAEGAWQTPAALSTAQSNGANDLPNPQIDLDASGDAVAVWQAFDGTNYTVVASTRKAGGAWPAPAAATTLSSDSEAEPGQQLAVDPRGNAAVVWSLFDGSAQIVQAAGYDGSGPLLNALSIPPSGTVGVPVTFSVTPQDAWSPVASTTWTFGDGQTGGAEKLTHTYAKAGTYTVTVTSADALGNATSQSGKITIASAPKPPAAPALTAVSETHKKWRESSGKHKAKRPPVGTSFSFSVDEAAGVTLTFSRTVGGRKVKGRCVAATKHDRKRPRCHRSQAKGTLLYNVASGAHKIAFRGRVGKRKLPLGSYALAVEATSGKLHSRTATLKFTIVK